MGNMKRIVSIKEFKEMNGLQVPIYKSSWVSKETYNKATLEAAKRLNDSEATLDDKTLVDTLKEHAEATIKEGVQEATPEQVAKLAEVIQEQNSVTLIK